MLMTIDCPSCGDPLKVPEDAAGKRARCNHCQGRFVVPSAEELLESTVSHFALEEMDIRRGEHDLDEASGSGIAAMAEARSRAAARPPAGPPARPPASNAGGPDPLERSSGGTVMGISAVGRNPGAGKPGETAMGVPLTLDSMGGSMAGGVPSFDSGSFPAAGSSSVGMASVAGERAGQPAGQPAVQTADQPAGQAVSESSDFPQELQPQEARPHLVVRRVSVDGVLLAFDAKWLHHDRFRWSVPVRSAFNGEPDREKLTARPMVFLDAVVDPAPRARPIELRYEEEVVRKEDTPWGIAGRMGLLQNLRSPFDRPIVYYAHGDASLPAMSCRVRALGDERHVQVCEVLVPNGRVAIEWLAAVNGNCGEEYPLLCEEIERSGQTAWDELPQKVRDRLEPWCGFQRGERFLAYFNDPDFSSSEKGLAGVVVTDKRLIYHKYRRLRSVSLHSPATLHLRKDGIVTRLTVTAGERRAKAGKMSHGLVSEFLQALPKGHRLALDAPHLGLSSRAV